MIVTPTEIAELFAEAQRLASSDRLPPELRLPTHEKDPWWRVRRRALEASRKNATRQLRAERHTFVVEPLAASVERRCECGGYWERRVGLQKLVHVGRVVRDVCEQG